MHKTLSIAKPLIILLVGLPGSGKSYFAKQFAQTFNVPLASADDIRQELFASPQFTSDENQIVSRVQNIMIGEFLKTKGSILVDGNCNSKQERLAAEKLAKDNSYELLVVWVQTSPDVAKSRAIKSADKPTKHTAISDSAFNRLKKTFNPPSPTENYVVISGMHTYTTQARSVLRKLASSHTEKSKRSEEQKTRPSKPPTRGNVIIR